MATTSFDNLRFLYTEFTLRATAPGATGHIQQSDANTKVGRQMSAGIPLAIQHVGSGKRHDDSTPWAASFTAYRGFPGTGRRWMAASPGFISLIGACDSLVRITVVAFDELMIVARKGKHVVYYGIPALRIQQVTAMNYRDRNIELLLPPGQP